MSDNPSDARQSLLSPGLPRSIASRRSQVAVAVALIEKAASGAGRGHRRRLSVRLDRHRQVLDVLPPTPLGMRLGREPPLSARMDCAPPTTRRCPGSPSSGPAWVPMSACTRGLQRPSTRHAGRPWCSTTLRDFVLVGRRAAGRRQRAFRRHPGAQAELSKSSAKNALDATDATYYASLAGWVPEDVPAAHAAAGFGEGPGYRSR